MYWGKIIKLTPESHPTAERLMHLFSADKNATNKRVLLIVYFVKKKVDLKSFFVIIFIKILFFLIFLKELFCRPIVGRGSGFWAEPTERTKEIGNSDQGIFFEQEKIKSFQIFYSLRIPSEFLKIYSMKFWLYLKEI